MLLTHQMKLPLMNTETKCTTPGWELLTDNRHTFNAYFKPIVNKIGCTCVLSIITNYARIVSVERWCMECVMLRQKAVFTAMRYIY